jgi:DNA-directed RNA polymerase specialized sigma subunit
VRNLKTGLNAPFYKWVDDVKKAIRHKRELEEKLEYYQSRLTGYQAVVYDSIGSSSSRNNVEDNLLFIIGKIDAIEHKLKEVDFVINDYVLFKEKLIEKEALLLEMFVETNLQNSTIALRVKVSKSRLFQIINELSRKFN